MDWPAVPTARFSFSSTDQGGGERRAIAAVGSLFAKRAGAGGRALPLQVKGLFDLSQCGSGT